MLKRSHAMITDIAIAYQNAALEGIFEHDKYGAAVANIGQIDRVA
jgi:hypothetical protein